MLVLVRYLVVGAGGHAQEVAWALVEHERGRGESPELLFFDDALPTGPLPSGLGAVAGPLEAIADHADRRRSLLVLGVGLPSLKMRLGARVASLGLAWATVVHPRAAIGPNVEIGPGSYIAAGAIVTVNVRLGAFVTVNMHAQVAHDGIVGAHATLHPNAHVAGNVRIGAGGVALDALEDGVTYVGVPARPVRRAARRSA